MTTTSSYLSASDKRVHFGLGTNPNGLTTFFLGGYTQTQMMKIVNPTFATVWLGNDDVLGAATNAANAGDTLKITDTTTFKTRYAAVLDSIGKTSVRGGVLIAVGNVTLIPFFSKGSTYFALKNAVPSPFPINFHVDLACAPAGLGGVGDNVLVPVPFGLGLVGLAQANPAVQDTLHCTEAQVVVPAELVKITSAVTSYNTYIAAQAAARGFAYFDPNALFTALPTGSIPAFPTTTGTGAVTAPFGNYFSRDGVHQSVRPICAKSTACAKGTADD